MFAGLFRTRLGLATSAILTRSTMAKNGTFSVVSVLFWCCQIVFLGPKWCFLRLNDLVVDGCGCAFALDGSCLDEFFGCADDAALADVQFLHQLFVLQGATSVDIHEKHQDTKGDFCRPAQVRIIEHVCANNVGAEFGTVRLHDLSKKKQYIGIIKLSAMLMSVALKGLSCEMYCC
jgi:hypothetical protein